MIGPYVVEGAAGRGAMGEVWRARHAETDLPVAIKVLTGRAARDSRFQERFRQEVRAVAGLDHRCVVQVYDYGVVPAIEGAGPPPGSPYLVMEWARGGTLDGALPLGSWEAVQGALVDILDGLAHAHARGVLHRDVKPQNVLRRTEDGPWVLADWGIARIPTASDAPSGVRSASRPPTEGEFAGDPFAGPGRGSQSGTPAYMAPEQASSRNDRLGPWTDLYAVGCLAWKLATGSLPYSGSVLEVLWGHMSADLPPFRAAFAAPDGLVDWLRVAMAKNPADRFRFAADARAALLAIDGAGRVPAKPVPAAFPTDWRSEARGSVASLPGAGLGLVGLRPIPIVDRSDERDRLWAALRSVRETGRAEVVALVGPAGSGKSRLCRWLCERAHAAGQAISVFATGPGGLERASASPSDPEATVPRDAPSRHLRFLDALTRRAEGRALVLWFDDAHEESDALAFTARILDARRTTADPVLVLLTLPDEGLAETPDAAALYHAFSTRSGFSAIRVGPLAPAYRAELVREVLGLEAELGVRVAERSGGQPLWVVETVRSWAERGLLEASPGGYRLRGEPDFPVSMQDMWANRFAVALSGEEEAAREAIEVGAVLGHEVDRVEWERACAVAGLPARVGSVEKLVEARLAVAAPGGPVGGWSFVHAMARECVLAAARDADRIDAWHAACADALDGSPVPDALERCGRHRLAAGQFDAAIDPLLRASRARDLRAEFPAALALARDAERALDALGAPESDRRRAAAALHLCRALRYLGRLKEALAESRRAAELARRHGWLDLELLASGEIGLGLRLGGDPAGARMVHEPALARARAAGDREALAYLLRFLAAADSAQGRLDDAEARLQEAIPLAERLEQPVHLNGCIRELGAVHMQQGRLDQAEGLFVRALDHARSNGLLGAEGVLLNDLGDLSRSRGVPAAARAWYEQARALFRRIGHPLLVVIELNVAAVEVEASRWREAREILDRLEHDPQVRARTLYLAGVHALASVVAAGRGDWVGFDAEVGHATELLHRMGMHDTEFARAFERAADLATGAGHAARAERARALAKAYG